ncbi:DUF2642 domain-containing protein [Cytobacillus depressus]|uniref:DUF2642 domain-containing protein n=1 Tax=Cytobacillus depressus TaxID=1602942 RepID=A0A6L3VC91_9BACI|nr:DUF2642 domain-containing protein [Cytobacillus depressus]KAB2338639.1 DUF2642 domain-containing protein [Cytobacillus depressus]
MKNILKKLIGENIKLQLPGKRILKGMLIAVGSDVIVLFDGKDYLYLPIVHIQNITKLEPKEADITPPTGTPNIEHDEELSLRKVLNLGKGMFTEIYITGNQPIPGYISSIMNNYFVFYSPVYKTMLISLNHLKWLIPYTANQRPYSLSNQQLPLHPVNISLARTLEVQIEKMVNELVILNIGENADFIGKLNSLQNNFIELVTAREELIYLNMQHIKTIHFTNI